MQVGLLLYRRLLQSAHLLLILAGECLQTGQLRRKFRLLQLRFVRDFDDAVGDPALIVRGDHQTAACILQAGPWARRAEGVALRVRLRQIAAILLVQPLDRLL